jgi:G3E family GTPase
VLVNDFGKINIDSESVLGVKGDVISLANGCVCCQVHEDLVNTVMEVIGRLERATHSM